MVVSKAAVKRLVQDSNKKYNPSLYDDVIQKITSFITEVVPQCVNIAKLSNRKLITTSHVIFAIKSTQIKFPAELYQVKTIKNTQRCNYSAPAMQRKQSSFYTELPAAQFSRLFFSTLKSLNVTNRFSQSARRLMHLFCEAYIMQSFEPIQYEDCTQINHVDSITNALNGDCELAHDLMKMIVKIDNVLRATNKKVLDAQLIYSFANDEAVKTLTPPNQLIKVCDRVLRGIILDKRIARNSAAAVAALLQYFKSKTLHEIKCS